MIMLILFAANAHCAQRNLEIREDRLALENLLLWLKIDPIIILLTKVNLKMNVGEIFRK